MEELRELIYYVDGRPVTAQMTKAYARFLGVPWDAPKDAEAGKDKPAAEKPADGTTEEDPVHATAKAKTPANKADTPKNK